MTDVVFKKQDNVTAQYKWEDGVKWDGSVSEDKRIVFAIWKINVALIMLHVSSSSSAPSIPVHHHLLTRLSGSSNAPVTHTHTDFYRVSDQTAVVRRKIRAGPNFLMRLQDADTFSCG